ncbi:hypothetical protein [Vibrio sp. ECSMB14106]|uniref:hypothetical protein n=1 Tax=Vibrio sp. ECSMB14106 TaxID=1638949 RepID=UPI00061A0807|nr:hypothetical protein [Vibrio sp. ECSMB14106]
MASCRGNCQIDMLLGKEAKSDFEPVEFATNRHDLKMKQPANIDMFYGLRNSRIEADNADLLRKLGRTAKGAKNTDRRSFKPLKYK